MAVRAGLAAIGCALVMAGGVAAAQERTRFEFWHGLTGDLGARVDETCKRFNDSQAEFEAVCVGQGTYDAAVQNAIAAYRAGKHPTVLQVFDAGTTDLMLSGAFVPAKRLMSEAGYQVDWNDYFPGIANYYATSTGELYSFPYNSSTAMLYWNRDAFAQIGRDKAPETWEEVEAAARAMKERGVACPYAFDVDTWQFMEQFSAIHGQPIATKANGYEGLDAELVVNRTKFVDHVRFFKRMFDEQLFVLKEYGSAERDSFASGECMMMQTSIADHGTIGKTAKPGMNWAVAMMPVWAGTERRNSVVGGASLWVLGNHSEAEQRGAAALLAFIAKPESALWWSTVTGYIPVTNSGYDLMVKNGFYEQPANRGRELAIRSLTFTPPTPESRGIRLGGFIQIRKEMRDGLTAIFADQASVEDGLNQAVERSNAVLRRFERTYAGKQLP